MNCLRTVKKMEVILFFGKYSYGKETDRSFDDTRNPLQKAKPTITKKIGEESRA
ncbi:MAG: hypothetical protein ACLTS6_06970 [Anaerobutyricum sp.]